MSKNGNGVVPLHSDSLPLEISSVKLPKPSRERFTPLRLGIVNIWQYDYQQWWFEGGNLLLRGDNTVGKTKVIELTLPFLLDAQMHPNRLDPFGQREGRSMHWNLLEGGELGQNQREGFTWMEFGRVDAEGGEHYVTIGAWLRATSITTKVEPAWFVTEKRVDLDLILPRAGDPTIGREGLKRQIGSEHVFSNRHDYQRAVDQALYGLGLERFREMNNLLLQLRQPKLSATLKPSKLTGILAESLPPVDEDQIANLADQYEQLEEYQDRIKRLQLNREEVDTYLRSQRTFVRRHVRLAAIELRHANTKVEDEAKQLDAVQREQAKSQEICSQLEREQSAAKEKKDGIDGRLEAARQSPEMRTAGLLEQARASAERSSEALTEAQEAAAAAGAEVDAARAEAAQADADLRPVNDQLAQARRNTEKSAAGADLEVLHQSAAAQILDKPEESHKKMRALAAAKRTAAEELKTLADQIQPAENYLEVIKGQVANQDAAADEKREAAQAAADQAQEVGEGHLNALRNWQDGLVELALAEAERESLYENALDLEQEPALAVPRRRAAALLEAAQVEARTALERVVREIADLDREVDEVQAQTEISPAPPRTRQAEREGRPGAPFYRCVDFSSALSEKQSALLEAALEASGLLDAWVWPDGKLESEVVDTSVVIGSSVKAPLAKFLHPVEGELPRSLISRLLASLSSDPSSENYVSADGRWQLGSLRGRAAKAKAEFVGASAREQARQRRLHELRAKIQGLKEEQKLKDEALGAIKARLATLEAEVAAYPSRAAYAQARRASERADGELHSAQGVLAQLKAQEAAQNERLQTLKATLTRRAEELELTAYLGRLPAMLANLRAYEDQITTFYLAALKLNNLRRAVERAVANLEAQQKRLAAEEDKVDRRRGEHARARAQADELERSAEGKAALDALARVETLKAELKEVERGLEELARQILEANRKAFDAQGQLRVLRDQHAQSSQKRSLAGEKIAELARRGAVALALGQSVDLEGEWSMTRALELSRRQIEPALQNEPSSPEHINSAQTNLTRAFTTLTSALDDYRPTLEWELDLPKTTAIYNQVPVDIQVLRQRLSDEIEAQLALMTEKEKDIFERFLMGDLANHLRERNLRAEQQIADINKNLAAHPTTSGMTLRLSWVQHVEESSQRQTLDWLKRDPSLLTDYQREALREFFQARISSARVQAGNQTWREHLSSALDYRRWHHLTIEQKQADGKKVAFTDARYASGSGGEKSVGIHQPLFAAAATYYDSAGSGWAPRLIILDEAFAGIDFPTRGRCLEMAEQFDLDLCMTSYEEMGTHEEVPALAIYQMVRDPSRRGVYCERWVWNGHQLALA